MGFFTLAGVASCSSDTAVPIACAGDDRCPAPSNNIPWAVQLSPNGSGTSSDLLMEQDQTRITWDNDGGTLLQFRAVSKLSGKVLEPLGSALSGARVTARLYSTIPGQSAYSLGTVTSESPDAGSWGIRVPLPQDPSNQPYRLWVGFDSQLLSSVFPPLWRDVLVVPELGQNIAISLQLRPQSELAVVTGRIVSPLGDGVGNLLVQVLDATGQIISTTAVSDASTGTSGGNYRVLLDPALNAQALSALTVVVRPGPNSSELVNLEATLQPPRVGSETRVDFAVPSHRAPVEFRLPIRGGTSGSTSVPVIGARVRAVVSLEDMATMKLGHRAYYAATADTDDKGNANLLLVPAANLSNLIYQVTISSPSHLPFASLPVGQVQVGPQNGLLGAVNLGLRAEVRGRLIDASGKPAAGVGVVATRITADEVYTSPFSSMITTVDLPQSTTDVDGTFALRVDAADYDFEFLPMPGTGARSSLDNLRIGADDQDLGEIHLPQATLGAVSVLSPLGAAVANAKVRVFQLSDTTPRPNVSCLNNLPCSRNALLRAEAFTDANGRAQLLLPGGSATR